MTEDLKAHKITFEDIMRGYEDPACGGLGYLGERRQHRYDRRFRDWGDVLAVDLANEQNMTHKQFSDWLESRYGHYFGDAVFGGFNHKQAEADACHWHLVRIVKPEPLRSMRSLGEEHPDHPSHSDGNARQSSGSRSSCCCSGRRN
jgi:hypothetical protein